MLNAGAQLPPRNPSEPPLPAPKSCQNHAWTLPTLQSPMKLVIPTAYGLDLEVPGEVRQCDLLQLSLQNQQPLLGRCRQGKASVSLVTLPPLLCFKFFSGSHLPWLERPVSLLTVITSQAARPSAPGSMESGECLHIMQLMGLCPFYRKEWRGLYKLHDQKRICVGCDKHWKDSRARILAMTSF